MKSALRLRVLERTPGNLRRATGELRLATRTIGDFSQIERVEALVAITNRKWMERDDAIRAAAGHLGFRRVRNNIRDAFKTAINGAIRRGLLEYEGSQIRRKAKS